MSARRLLAAGLVILVAVVLGALAVRANDSSGDKEEGEEGEESEHKGEPKAPGEEAQDEEHLTASRLEALAQAKAAGKFGANVTAATTPASGWAGSAVMSSQDD